MLQKIDSLYWRGKGWIQGKANEFLYEEDGDVNVVSIVVLIAIAVILAAIFRKNIEALLTKLFTTITTQSDNATKAP